MKTEKDPMIVFRTVSVGKNSKGGDRITLKLGGGQSEDAAARNAGQIDALIDVLTSLKASPRGVSIDLHITDKETEDGRGFKSAIAFVREVAEFGAGGPKRTGFKPKADVAAVAASLNKRV